MTRLMKTWTVLAMLVLSTLLVGQTGPCGQSPPPPPADRDADGIPDTADNCPDVANAGQQDSNANGVGDACETAPPADRDADGIPDATDNCPDTANASQADADADGLGDACDPGGGTVRQAALIADHLAPAAFDAIPAATIQAVQSNYRVWYSHTSHGSQIVTGMGMIYSADSRYAFNAGAGSLTLEDHSDLDLGTEGSLDWVTVTRDALNAPGANINVVMWSWCGGLTDNSEAGVATYLDAMNQLEADYPNVTFVYMTGHLDGSGPSGNLYARNNQIRSYCQAHNKVLFDFADIESYDPAGTYYPDGSDACEWCITWCGTHTCPPCEDCAHSQCMNCYQKGRAFWWMMARLAGWAGS